VFRAEKRCSAFILRVFNLRFSFSVRARRLHAAARTTLAFRCPFKPYRRVNVAKGECTDYAADANAILAKKKCEDDRIDAIRCAGRWAAGPEQGISQGVKKT
jgi:hypothetical protein